MIRKEPYIILLFALASLTYQYFYLTAVKEIDYLSLLAEGTITITVCFILINLHHLRKYKLTYYYLSLGFSLLFVAFFTDTLDEVFDHPKLLTTVLEDTFQVLGFFIVLIGISKWIKLNAEQNKELRMLAATDTLTGLYTRRHIQESIYEEFIRRQSTNTNFAVLMIDIDHFKSINDKYGHSAGDMVLQRFSNEIRNSIRKTDTVARWGGEEFIILLTDIDQNICSELSEKIRQKTENFLVPTGSDSIHFTVSIGVAISNDKDNSVDTIIDRADKLLYEAKQNGRNCIALDFPSNEENGAAWNF